MSENLIDAKTFRNYLLGDLPDAERAALEDAFLRDRQIFEQIEDAENDLVDDYAGERLSASERRLFETYYLATPEKRAKVETARVLRRERQNLRSNAGNAPVAESPAENQAAFWQKIQKFFASGMLAPAAGFAVLLFLIGGLWFAFRPSANDEIALLPTPAPTTAASNQISPTPAPEANFNAAENSNQTPPQVVPPVQKNANAATRPAEPDNRVQPAPRQTAPASQSIVTLALVAGLVRGDGGGEAIKLSLPKNADRVRLTFDLPAKKYRQIEARIETAAGEKIWSGKIKQTGGRVALVLPAKLFADEDYLLIASGIGETGERTDFAQFYFNSERK